MLGGRSPGSPAPAAPQGLFGPGFALRRSASSSGPASMSDSVSLMGAITYPNRRHPRIAYSQSRAERSRSVREWSEHRSPLL